MSAKRTLGTIIIGIAITLAVAITPLLIFGDDPITGTSVGPPYNVQLEGDNLFVYLFFIGLSIVTMIALRKSKKNIKTIIYPTLIGVIGGIVLGIIIPIHQLNRYHVHEFNIVLFYAILGVGIFISLIVLGRYLIQSK